MTERKKRLLNAKIAVALQKAAKGLARWAQRCFAALSMTGLEIPVD